MKKKAISKLLIVIGLTLGLLFSWSVCFSQNEDISKQIGRCGCSYNPCDWHDVPCKPKPKMTCGKSDACCRGPDTGSGYCVSPAGYLQCVYPGCMPRPEEICMSD